MNTSAWPKTLKQQRKDSKELRRIERKKNGTDYSDAKFIVAFALLIAAVVLGMEFNYGDLL